MMGTYEKTFFAGWVYASRAVRGRHGHHHLTTRSVLHEDRGLKVAVPYESFPIPGLEVFDGAQFEAKMRRFGAAGLSSVHGVFDFDLTLTAPTNDKRPLSSWSMLEDHLPPDAKAYCIELFERYYPLEQSGKMTLEDAETWWGLALAAQRDSKVNLIEVEADFLKQDSIRAGSRELYEFLDRNEVHNIILSAGVKNVIDIWCRAHGISPTAVVSTEFFTDDDGRMTGWDESSVVHVLNKGESAHPELLRLRTERPNVIVLGDSIHDADMAQGEDNVIRIRVVDTYPTHAATHEQIREKTAERFDAMIKDGDLFPVRAVLDRIDAYADAS